MRTSRINGTPSIAYEIAGEGPPVVFLHGIGGNRTMWRPQTEAAPVDFTVISWDARGYGDSDDYDGPLRFEDFSEDLVRLLDGVGAENAHLVGLSMGARILMDFHPKFKERVATLTLCDCFPSFDKSLTPEKRAEFVNLRKAPLIDGKTLEELAPALIDSLASPNCSENARQLLWDNLMAIHVPSYLKTLEATFQYDRSAALGEMTVPVCLIFGEMDRLTPPSIGEDMLRQLPDASLNIIPGAGHLSNIEAPEVFNEILFAFLRQHAALARFK